MSGDIPKPRIGQEAPPDRFSERPSPRYDLMKGAYYRLETAMKLVSRDLYSDESGGQSHGTIFLDVALWYVKEAQERLEAVAARSKALVKKG